MRISTLFLPRLLVGVSLAAIAVPISAQTAPTPVPAPAPAPTTTLRDALVEAYNTNPDLAGERATLRANDENVPIARASGLPGVTSTGSASQSLYDSGTVGAPSGVSPTRTGNLELDLTVPVYSGGSVRNSVRAAQTRVEAGRANLRGANRTSSPRW